ncbi:MAG: putative Ig domain-containing protein [Bacteroidota bacterium]
MIRSKITCLLSGLMISLSILSCDDQQSTAQEVGDYIGQSALDSIPKVFASDIISKKGRFELGLSISPSGRHITFGVAHESDPTQTNLYIINQKDGEWSSPDKSFLPGNVNTFFPMFSPSGGQLYFTKSVGDQATDVWVVDFSDGLVTKPRPLNQVINSDSREAGHGVLPDGTLYFTSNRDDQHACCGDIYRSSLDSGEYTKVQKMDILNSVADEESLFLSPNGDYIIIQAWKNEYASKHDLYISYMTKGSKWTQPRRLSSAINSPEIEQRPFVSFDNKYLFFSRTNVTEENGEFKYDSDIYWVNTKSVFHPYVYNTPSQTVVVRDQPFEIQFPRDIFKDVDGDELNYSMSTVEGTSLPEGMTFDAQNITLSGVLKQDNPGDFILSATDEYGNSSQLEFTLD